MSTQTTAGIAVGDIVTAVPVGQRRTQTFKVTHVDADFAVGLLLSKKYPGDYRGQVVAWAAECRPAKVTS